MSAEEKRARLKAVFAGYTILSEQLEACETHRDCWLEAAVEAEKNGREEESSTYLQRAEQHEKAMQAIHYSLANERRLQNPFGFEEE